MEVEVLLRAGDSLRVCKGFPTRTCCMPKRPEGYVVLTKEDEDTYFSRIVSLCCSMTVNQVRVTFHVINVLCLLGKENGAVKIRGSIILG